MSAYELIAFLIPLAVALTCFCVGLWQAANTLRCERDAARKDETSWRKAALLYAGHVKALRREMSCAHAILSTPLEIRVDESDACADRIAAVLEQTKVWPDPTLSKRLKLNPWPARATVLPGVSLARPYAVEATARKLGDQPFTRRGAGYDQFRKRSWSVPQVREQTG